MLSETNKHNSMQLQRHAEEPGILCAYFRNAYSRVNNNTPAPNKRPLLFYKSLDGLLNSTTRGSMEKFFLRRVTCFFY